jgi:uncharacterized protein (TIGR00661 family)
MHLISKHEIYEVVSKMTKILFSCMSIGLGHATRSLAVADELRKRGAEILFCIGKPYDEFVRSRGYEVTVISPEIKLSSKVGENLTETIKFINENAKNAVKSSINLREAFKNFEPDIVVSDSEPTSMFVSKLLNSKIPVVMILHQPKLFVNIFSSSINKIWAAFINKYSDKILLPDVVGLDIPEMLMQKTKRIGPIFRPVSKKIKMKKKTILFIPSFASSNKTENIKKIETLASFHKDWDFVILGQDKGKKINNVLIKKKENVKNSCDFIASSGIVVLSGYSSLMEAVYYQKPVAMIPTQLEQRKISEIGEKSGILIKSSFEDLSPIENLMSNSELRKTISRNQKKYHIDGSKQAAAEIMSSI